MKVLFYTLAIILSLLSIGSLINSINTSRKESDRWVDLLMGVCIFVCFLFLVKVFDGIIY